MNKTDRLALAFNADLAAQRKVKPRRRRRLARRVMFRVAQETLDSPHFARYTKTIEVAAEQAK